MCPTCQVRVTRFYQSCMPCTSASTFRPDSALNRELQIPVSTAGPQPRAPDLSEHRRTSTANSRAQWGLPHHCRTATASARACWHCWTSTASARSQWDFARACFQWALRDLNCKCKMTHRTSEYMPDRACQNRCQKEWQIECQRMCQERMPDRMSEYYIILYIYIPYIYTFRWYVRNDASGRGSLEVK